MSIVRGENVNVTFWQDSEFLGFSCVRSCTINMLSDFVGKSTINSGNWKEKEKVAWDWNINIEGAMYMDKDGFVGPEEMIDYWLSGSPVGIIARIEDTEGNFLDYYGSVIITNIVINGVVNNAGSMNFTGEGTGELATTS